MPRHSRCAVARSLGRNIALTRAIGSACCRGCSSQGSGRDLSRAVSGCRWDPRNQPSCSARGAPGAASNRCDLGTRGNGVSAGMLLIWSPLSIARKHGGWPVRGLRIDRVMRHERCSDDESDSYPRIGYQHFIDSSWACLALKSGISLAVPWSERRGLPCRCSCGIAQSIRGRCSWCGLLALCVGADGSHEAGQFARYGHADLVGLNAALVQRGSCGRSAATAPSRPSYESPRTGRAGARGSPCRPWPGSGSSRPPRPAACAHACCPSR